MSLRIADLFRAIHPSRDSRWRGAKAGATVDGWPTIVAFGCTHLPIHSETARQWRLEVIRRENPDIIIHLGDWLDADGASRWPNEHDWTLADEYEWLARDARDIRAAAPDAQCVWLQGNHDDNLTAPNRIPPKLRDACAWYNNGEVMTALQGWRVIPYGERHKYNVGPITFRHGCATGVNANPRAAMLHAAPYGLLVQAHTHSPQDVRQVIVPGNIPLPYWSANVGCGCDWDRMEYVHRQSIATWGHGIFIGRANAARRQRVFASKQWEGRIEVLRTAHD